MERHHTGSGRRSVIPGGWSGHHQGAVAGSFTADVTIRRPGGTEGAFDPETGTRPVTPFTPHFTGKARIQVQPILGSEASTAGQQVTVGGYLVAVDRDSSTETEVDDLVAVTAVDANGDPALVGRALTVTGVAYGSLSWERDLSATDNLG